MKPKGLILWEGPSRLDGAPLVAIATLRTANKKTGPMVQVWFLRSDIDPVSAVRDGLDRSICGACPLRGSDGFKARACYVNVGQAPLKIWKTFKRGGYPKGRIPPGSLVRLGAYGDPGAVPIRVIRSILRDSAAHTGYTHLWRTRPGLRGLVQASVETLGEALEAWNMGWSTFRLTDGPPLGLVGEKACPSARGISCARCKACSGASSRCVPAHGVGRKFV